MKNRLSFIHGFQDGVLGILPQSKDAIYLEAHSMGAQTLIELRETAMDRFPKE